jgi:hypothetical protein
MRPSSTPRVNLAAWVTTFAAGHRSLPGASEFGAGVNSRTYYLNKDIILCVGNSDGHVPHGSRSKAS